MPRTKDPEVLERLMEAGVHVFGALGLSNARISDVADEMGVSHGTIYNYVESKDALFHLLVDWWLRDGPPPLAEARLPLAAPPVERTLERLGERVDELFPLRRLDAALERSTPPADPAAELYAVLDELYERTGSTRRAADMIERSARDVPELADFFARTVRRPLFTRMETYLRSRARMGVLACGDPGAVARLVVETVTYAARHRHRDPDPPDTPDGVFRDATVELLCRGLLATPGGSAPAGPSARGAPTIPNEIDEEGDER